jgi:hypothetical protein
MVKIKHLSFTLGIVLLATIWGCGSTFVGNPGDDEENAGKPKPTITVSLTDAPVDDAAQVILKVASISVLGQAGEWKALTMTHTDPIDILSYRNGKTIEVVKDELEVGEYTEIKLLLDETFDHKIILKDKSEHVLKIVKKDHEVKIKDSFTVTEAGAALTIDVDLEKSIVAAGGSGQYILKPQMHMVKD